MNRTEPALAAAPVPATPGEAAWLRHPMALLSPAGPRARLSILIFHRVLAAPDPLLGDDPDVAGFERQMRWLRDWFKVLPLGEAVDRLAAGTLPARAACVTFDDGYADNEELAAPVLARLGLPATFFVSSGFLAGGCMWNDQVIEAVRRAPAGELDLARLGLGRHPLAEPAQRAGVVGALLREVRRQPAAQRADTVAGIVAACGSPALPAPMMQPAQVRNLRRLGMEVGAHTVSHPILARVAPEVAAQEIGGSKEQLEAILGERLSLFAYPNGVPRLDYAAEHVDMVRRCGFKAAVATAWGSAARGADLFQLPRFTPWDRSALRYGLRLLRNLRVSPQLL